MEPWWPWTMDRSSTGSTCGRRPRGPRITNKRGFRSGWRKRSAAEATIRVHLAVPRMKLGANNVQTGSSEGDARWARASVTVPDENRSGHEQPIQFRRLNVRLLLSSQDQSGYETLPIAQIKRAGDSRARPQL